MLGEDEEGACRVREVEYEFKKKKKVCESWAKIWVSYEADHRKWEIAQDVTSPSQSQNTVSLYYPKNRNNNNEMKEIPLIVVIHFISFECSPNVTLFSHSSSTT